MVGPAVLRVLDEAEAIEGLRHDLKRGVDAVGSVERKQRAVFRGVVLLDV